MTMPVYLFKQLRRKPDLLHSRPNVDFGCGFYVTPLFEQAAKWCGKFKRRGKNGIISRYEYDENQETELKTLKFDSYSEEWLDFILNCRSGRDTTNYDLVIGGVANDKVFNTVELFWDGLLIRQKPSIVCAMKNQTCKFVSVQSKHWNFFDLKGVKRYESQSDFASEKILPCS